MPEIRVGTVAFAASQQSDPLLVNVADPITELRLRLTGELNVTVTVALNEDAIQRIVRRIQVTKGGVPIKIIGNNGVTGAAFRIMNPYNRFIFGSAPELVQPALVAGVNAFSATVQIPFTLPRKLYRGLGRGLGRFASMLLPGGEEVRLTVDWGAVADIVSSGTATLQNVQIEVVAVTNNTFNVRRNPPRNFLKEVTQVLDITAGANTDEPLTLNRNGALPFMFMFNLDNGLRNNSVLNRLRFLQNASGILIDQSFQALRQNGVDLFNLQGATLLDGTAMVVFDRDGRLTGALDLDNPQVFNSFRVNVDHDALTGVFLLLTHHFFLDDA